MTSTLYHDGALADGRSDRLDLGVSILVTDGVIAWIRPADDEGPVPAGADVVDASGSVIVPGMIDAHSHLTLPGGAHWIDRIDDPAERLAAAAEANGRLLTRAGVRWARDTGSPTVEDPVDGRVRALALGVRDRWAGRPGYPHVRAAGSWLDRNRYIKINRSTSSATPAELLETAHASSVTVRTSSSSTSTGPSPRRPPGRRTRSARSSRRRTPVAPKSPRTPPTLTAPGSAWRPGSTASSTAR